ncbi:MAG: alpha/beta hydrolase [Sphaerobacteraceae bacterium]|nr:MAG: alpha/beta hydrolase [Sphaerobacteraceae bacterium]
MSAGQLKERTVSTGSIDLYVAMVEQSDSPTLVLLHGLYDRWEVWSPLIDQLGDTFSVIAPDLRGHARSDHPDSGYELADYAADVVGMLDTLGITQAIVAGHSLGALIGLVAAADHADRVSHLVMIDPPLRQGEQGRQLLEILLEARQGEPDETYQLISELYAFSGTEQDWRRQTDWLRATSEAALQGMIAMSDDAAFERYLSLIERVTCPVLLLQADPMSGGVVSDADVAEAQRRQPLMRQVRVPDTGHSVHQDAPSLTAREILSLTGQE